MISSACLLIAFLALANAARLAYRKTHDSAHDLPTVFMRHGRTRKIVVHL